MRVTIDSLAYGGDSVARLDDGRVAFVAAGCPGDVADIEVTADRASHVMARIAALLQPSPDRVEPPCQYFGSCGGCQWQHVSSVAQAAAKERIVADAMARIGGLDVETMPLAPSPDAYGYRNKIELLAEEDEGGLRLGFHRLASSELVPVDRCLLLPAPLQDAPRKIAGALRYLSGRHGSLGLRRVGIRVARNTSRIEVALWTTPGSFPRQIAAKTIADAVGATSVVRVLVKGESKQRAVTGVEVLGGRGYWSERLGGVRMAVSAPSFFQVNTRAAETLVNSVLGALSPEEEDRVLDLYSGAGTFTVPLATRAGEVVAVESSRFALADLRRNLDTAQAWADVVGGDVARELPSLGAFDLAVVDPPRSGLSAQALSDLAGTGARRIAYVSCDPATLARDAARLAAKGYEAVHVTPHDLFPQTYHVEGVALFRRRSR